MSDQQSQNSAEVGRPELSGLVSHLSTPEEIARFAAEGNHTILWHFVQMHRPGKYTWGQAMQAAAFAQAETIAILNKQLFDCISRTPPHGVVANAALTGGPRKE